MPDYITINNIDYLILDEITIDNIKYVYLSEEDNPTIGDSDDTTTPNTPSEETPEVPQTFDSLSIEIPSSPTTKSIPSNIAFKFISHLPITQNYFIQISILFYH